MWSDVLIWCFIASPAVAGLVQFVVFWFDIPHRTSDDVIEYLVPVDLAKLESLLDPSVEFSYRLYLHPNEFQRVQLKRLHQLLELVRRMSRNADVLVHFANDEAETTSPAVVEAATKLRDCGVTLRIYSLGARATLFWWLLFRSHTPAFVSRRLTVARLRTRLGIPVLETYREVKSAAEGLYALRCPNRVDELLQSL